VQRRSAVPRRQRLRSQQRRSKHIIQLRKRSVFFLFVYTPGEDQVGISPGSLNLPSLGVVFVILFSCYRFHSLCIRSIPLSPAIHPDLSQFFSGRSNRLDTPFISRKSTDKRLPTFALVGHVYVFSNLIQVCYANHSLSHRPRLFYRRLDAYICLESSCFC